MRLLDKIKTARLSGATSEQLDRDARLTLSSVEDIGQIMKDLTAMTNASESLTPKSLQGLKIASASFGEDKVRYESMMRSEMSELDIMYQDLKGEATRLGERLKTVNREINVVKYCMSARSNDVADVKALQKLCAHVQIERLQMTTGGAFF